jgi:hypothetical protein
MARIKPLLPTAIAGGKAKPNFTETKWKRIESAYGKKLSNNVRKKIREASQQYLEWEVFERNAKPTSEAIKRIKQFQEAASFASRTFVNQDQGPEVRAYVKSLVRNRLHLDRFPEKERKDPVRYLADTLRSLSSACKSSLNEIDTIEKEGYRKGDCWEQWIRQLTKIAKENDLPNGVRSDSDKQKNDAPSPFVALVRELQLCLPAESRRPAHSDGALAQAIKLARRSRPLEAQSAKAESVDLTNAPIAETALTESEIFHEAVSADRPTGSPKQRRPGQRNRAHRQSGQIKGRRPSK